MTLRPQTVEFRLPDTARYIRISLFASLTGYTQKAVRRKIQAGVWVQNREYRKAPDGSVVMDLEGYNRWVEAGAGRV